MENKNLIDKEQESEKDFGTREGRKITPAGGEKSESYLYYSQLFNSIILGFFLLVLSGATLKAYFLITEFRDFLNSNKSKLSSTIINIESSSKALEQSAKAVQEVSEAQNKLLTDLKTQQGIATLLRQADDVARSVKKVNIILDNINKDILPNTNRTIKATENTINQAGTTLRQTEVSIAKLTSKSELILDSTNSSIIELHAILGHPKLKVIIDNVAATTEESNLVLSDLDLSAKEINKMIPQLLDNLKRITDNTDLSGREITTFLEGINKPQSKKQRLGKLILETIIKSSPVLLKR